MNSSPLSTSSTPRAQIRIALPLAGDSLSEHFGGASQFRFIEAEVESKAIINHVDLAAPEHVPGAFPKWLAQQGVHAVIVGGIGRRAVQLFQAHGILVYHFQPGLTPDELVHRLLEGRLSPIDPEACCSGHQHHGHGHHHHGHGHGTSCS